MKRLLSILLLLVSASIAPCYASHIVGGEMTYTCLGNSTYKVSLSIYEDCINGSAEVIAEDDPAFLVLYNENNDSVRFDAVHYSTSMNVPTNFDNACVNNVPATCLIKKTFEVVYNLPSDRGGNYTVVYQRCCRNKTVLNIVDPADHGATYYCVIPPPSVASCNNSAVFKNYPPQIICIKEPLVYDHSAIDPDGDSLSYEFCQTYDGGTDLDSKPIPLPPPFIPLTYMSPFTFANPMPGGPGIKIDPVSGLITGTPNLVGRFVVAVCCHEWRHGQMINTVTREFQFVVTDCSKAVVANIPQYSSDFNTYRVNCKNLTVHFENTSKGGFSYLWDFGVGGATSTEFEPTFTYPDTGVYLVKLTVNPGTTCTDSISRFVKLYPVFTTDYIDSGLQCPGSPLSFGDKTVSTYKPITQWLWSFGDGDTSGLQNPVHTFKQGGTYNVVLSAQNVKHCTDTTVKQILIERFQPFAGSDTIIVKGQSLYFDATGGNEFTWVPGTYLNDSSINDPVGYYPDTGHFRYVVHIVSPFGCSAYDTLHVQVVGQPSYFVPNAFTPNHDGKNDRFRVLAVGYSSLNFKVFNRWGQNVFTSRSFENGWDGTIGSRPADMDTYFWMLTMTDLQGKTIRDKGDVLLLR